MKIAYIYILGESSNPDVITCGVPYEINSKEIFFGPCKAKLRKYFWNKYLKNSKSKIEKANNGIFFIGLNSASSERKIVWAGEMKLVMTFKKAFELLKGSKYNKMRSENKWIFNLEYPEERTTCFLLDNIFFANGEGIRIDSKIIRIFKNAQQDRNDIDEYAIFGYQTNNSMNGKRGSWLELNEKLADEIISIIKKRLRNIKVNTAHSIQHIKKSCS